MKTDRRLSGWIAEIVSDVLRFAFGALLVLFAIYVGEFFLLWALERIFEPFGTRPGTPSYFFVRFFQAQVDFVNGATMSQLMTTIIGGLVVAGVSWTVATLRTKMVERNRVAEVLDAAPRNYVAELDKLITQAISEGRDNAILNARAIVKVRDDLRSSLVTVSSKLNSEIDRLARQLGRANPPPQGPSVAVTDSEPYVSKDAAWDTIQVLQRVWPAKKREIEDAIRQIQTEIGLDPNKYRKAA